MKLDQLTFTRFLAAIAIVIFHDGAEIFPFNLPILKTLFKQADLGVSYFFVLSGFVMIVAYNKKEKISYAQYYLNRIARIYPIYITGLVLILPFYFQHLKGFRIQSFILNALCLQAWVPSFALNFNSPEWSISVEVLFYLTFPFLFNKIYKRYNWKSLVLPILLIWIISQVVFNYLYHSAFYTGYPSNNHNLLYYFPVFHINEFLVGNLAGLIFLKIATKSKSYNLPIAICVIVFLFVVQYNTNININFHDGGLAILFAIFITLLSLSVGRITNLFSLKELVFLGEISYGIYIFQLPVGIFTKATLKAIGMTNDTIVFYIYLTALMFVAAISYLYVERPLRDVIRDRKMIAKFKYLLNLK